jgi:hypothetical protein
MRAPESRLIIEHDSRVPLTSRWINQFGVMPPRLLPRGGGGVDSVPMGRTATVLVYVLAMVAVVLVLDVTIFRHLFWERLAANVGVVLVFGAFYFRFVHRA